MITDPSPRMVLPLNIVTWRRIGATGLTTISSVSNTRSTMMPSMVEPTCTTTMVASPVWSPSLSRASRSARLTSGSSRSRNRSTGVSLIRSITLLEAPPAVLLPARCARTSSTTLICGMAKRSPTACTISAETMARVSGILMMKVVPWPATLFRSMVPPIFSMLVFTTSMPTPRPDTAVTTAAVENPARKMKRCNLPVAHARELGVGRQPLRQHLGADLVHRQAAAVIGDLDDDVAALVEGVQRDAAAFRLAHGAALGRPLQAVVARVAHHMGERILDQLQHLAVQLGVGAEHHQLDLLVHFQREVAHQPRQIVPGIADRLHARLHHALLQIGGDVRQPLQRRGEAAVLLGAGELEKLVAGQHQFADQGHKVLEHLDGDTNGLGRRGAVVAVAATAASGGRPGGAAGAGTASARLAVSSDAGGPSLAGSGAAAAGWGAGAGAVGQPRRRWLVWACRFRQRWPVPACRRQPGWIFRRRRLPARQSTPRRRLRVRRRWWPAPPGSPSPGPARPAPG